MFTVKAFQASFFFFCGVTATSLRCLSYWTAVNEFIYILTPFVLVLVGLLFLGSMCASVLTVWPKLLSSHPDGPTLTVMRRIISLVQTHYHYENARRNRVYGKHIPNTRVDTSELADRVSPLSPFWKSFDLKKCPHPIIIVDRRLASATSFEPVPMKGKKEISTVTTQPSLGIQYKYICSEWADDCLIINPRLFLLLFLITACRVEPCNRLSIARLVELVSIPYRTFSGSKHVPIDNCCCIMPWNLSIV
jgi:hypothetical protein